MAESEETARAIAESLWERFRLLALAVDREESFVGMGPTGESLGLEEEKAKAWLAGLGERPEEVRAIARELVLRALRQAFEPVNVAILRRLAQEPSRFSDLLSGLGLDRISLGERVNDLIQVGLATREIEAGTVQATPAAVRLLELVEGIEDSLVRLMTEKIGPLVK